MSARHSYDVGYKKPPEKHQFKPGKSGNPKGRPRKNRDSNMDAAMAFLEPLGGQAAKTGAMTALHAGYARMLKKALEGDRASMAAAIDLILEANTETAWDMLKRFGLTPEDMGLSKT